MKTALLICAILACLLAAADANEQIPGHSDTCQGPLNRTDGQLTIGPSTGDEGICVIHQQDEAIVLEACRLGDDCVVFGSASLCEDEGECVEFQIVDKAKRMVKPPPHANWKYTDH